VADIIEFKRPEKADPHGTGEAFCFQCKHTWVAVAPVGSTQLECPECHTMKGLWKFPFEPSVEGREGGRWQCNCGNQLFYLTPKGYMCPNCGILQTY